MRKLEISGMIIPKLKNIQFYLMTSDKISTWVHDSVMGVMYEKIVEEGLAVWHKRQRNYLSLVLI
jgi:hypothetical protein